MSCAADTAFEQKLANATAGYRLSTQAHLRIDHYAKTELFAQLLQFAAITLSAMSEMERQTFMDLFHVQPFHKNLLHKLLRRQGRESLIERQKQNCIHSR